jgi:ATP-dependent DNA helicase RecQ
LVSLIAGKARKSDEDKLTIMAVGDDDQSIYGFAGANIEFIRRYETDYANQVRGKKDETYMERHYLIENYRSTSNIIDATNRLIANNKDRMKIEFPIVRDGDRKQESPGGNLQTLDPVSEGKVQVLKVGTPAEQAEACIAELQRLKAVTGETNWSEFCVFARTNRELNIIRLALEEAGIPLVVLGAEAMPSLRRVRVVYQWLRYLKENASSSWSGDELKKQLESFLANTPKKNLYGQMLRTIASVFYGETAGAEQQVADIRFFFVEICCEKRINSNIDAVRLSTAHKAKGLEFDHVLILDGEWKTNALSSRDLEEERRVFYVAMTRARKSLTIFKLKEKNNRFIDELVGAGTLERSVSATNAVSDKLGIEICLLSLGDLWIDFAATLGRNDERLLAIERLQSGDQLHFYSPKVVNGKPRLELRTTSGIVVACLSRNGVEAWIDKLESIVAIQVVGVHIRKSDDGEQSYEGRNLKRDEWGVPISEVYWRQK